MSGTSQEEIAGRVAPRSLRDELASLKIDRSEERRPAKRAASSSPSPRRPDRPRAPRSGPGLSLRLLSWMLWMIPLAAVAGGGYYGYLQYAKMRSKPEVTVAAVESMTPVQAAKLLSAKGYLKSRYQANIGARTPGRVERVLVEEGTRVKKGQLLAVLEHNDMDAILESRRASIARVEADIEEAKADLKEKDRKARLQASLLARNQVAADVAQEAAAAREMASARLRSLEANRKISLASMKEVEETIRNMNIYAPFDGTIVEKGAEEGETITPGGMGAASGRGSVATLADLGHIEVETDLTERDVSRVALGQPASVEVLAVPDRRFQGRLRQIIPMGDRARGTVKLKVEILDADEKLFPELEAKVHFLPSDASRAPDADKPALYVSRKAIVEAGAEQYAFVVDPRGRVQRRKVEAVVTGDDLARVNAGLTVGESVIVSPPATLRDGEDVKVSD